MHLKKKSFHNISVKAYNRGKRHKEMPDKIKKWLTWKHNNESWVHNFRLYKNFLFLFKGRVLVTVYDLKETYPEYFKEEVKDEKMQTQKQT